MRLNSILCVTNDIVRLGTRDRHCIIGTKMMQSFSWHINQLIMPAELGGLNIENAKSSVEDNYEEDHTYT